MKFSVYFPHHMKLALFLIFFVSHTILHAALYEGTVDRNRNKFFFKDPLEQKVYALTSQTPLLATYLNRLKSNDFISIDGMKNPSTEILTIKSINFVGLSDLIGQWVDTEHGHCLVFLSYTELHITPYRNTECDPQIEDTYNYFVNPSSKHWTILIAGDDTYVGDLRLITPTQLEIKLYNSDTGSILSLLKLRKK